MLLPKGFSLRGPQPRPPLAHVFAPVRSPGLDLIRCQYNDFAAFALSVTVKLTGPFNVSCFPFGVRGAALVTMLVLVFTGLGSKACQAQAATAFQGTQQEVIGRQWVPADAVSFVGVLSSRRLWCHMGVCSGCQRLQVGRIDATLVAAGVMDLMSQRDGTDEQQVSDAMSVHSVAFDRRQSVALFVDEAIKDPALRFDVADYATQQKVGRRSTFVHNMYVRDVNDITQGVV